MTKKSRLPLWLTIFGGLILGCLVTGLALFLFLTNLPPSALDKSGYYVRGGKVF